MPCGTRLNLGAWSRPTTPHLHSIHKRDATVRRKISDEQATEKVVELTGPTAGVCDVVITPVEMRGLAGQGR